MLEPIETGISDVDRGDRVIVINEDNEFIDCTGVFAGLTSDGRLMVEIDYTHWIVPFDAFDLELLDQS